MKGQIELFPLMGKKETILDYIPTGSKNAVSRKYLSEVTGMSDRILRDEIHKARCKIPIINLSDRKGYFIPDMNVKSDVNKLMLFVLQEESRIQEIQKVVDTAKRTLRNCGVIE